MRVLIAQHTQSLSLTIHPQRNICVSAQNTNCVP